MVTSSDYVDKSMLKVNADTYYFDTLRPFMQHIIKICRTDLELCRTVDKVINTVDSLSVRKQYKKIPSAFVTLSKGITDAHYFDTVMKSAPETEKQAVREFIQKINDYLLIVKYEPDKTEETPKQKERIDYKKSKSDAVGQNASYDTHNMKSLTEPFPKKRLPN